MLAGMESVLEHIEDGSFESFDHMKKILRDSIKDLESGLDLPTYEERRKGYKDIKKTKDQPKREMTEADEKEIREISTMIKN